MKQLFIVERTWTSEAAVWADDPGEAEILPEQDRIAQEGGPDGS